MESEACELSRFTQGYTEISQTASASPNHVPGGRTWAFLACPVALQRPRCYQRLAVTTLPRSARVMHIPAD